MSSGYGACVITCSLYPCICVAWVLQCTIVFENGRSICFFFRSSFSSNSNGVLSSVSGKRAIFRVFFHIHQEVGVFISCFRVLPGRLDTVHLGLLHHPVCPEYGQSSEYHGTFFGRIKMGLQQSKLLDLRCSLGHTVFELDSLRTPGAQYASLPLR